VTSAGGRLLVPDGDGIRRIQAKHGFLERLTVPAGSYPGQPEPLVSVGSWSFIMARPSLDADLVYRLARALHTGAAALARRLPQAAETTSDNTAAASPRRDLIHPGVLRHLRELALV
jgi:TRAP-type uncharacterized transport system substrate-binding protein